ncbi:MAG: class I SAM-dependent methyltransferase [Chloroflexia bacterium]
MQALHGHGNRQGSTGGHGHNYTQATSHGQGHSSVGAPATQGRLIRYARVYDGIVWAMAMGRSRALRALPVDLADVRPGERVLEVGCGTGDVAMLAARRVGSQGRVYGIDAAPEMVTEAQRKAHKAGLRVEFRVEPVEAMSFEDGSFDVVLSSLMMHHQPGDLKRRALVEIRRVLRPGGRLVIVDFQVPGRRLRPWEPGWLAMRRHGMDKAGAGQGRPGPEALGELLREAGFGDVESGGTSSEWMGFARGVRPSEG